MDDLPDLRSWHLFVHRNATWTWTLSTQSRSYVATSCKNGYGRSGVRISFSDSGVVSITAAVEIVPPSFQASKGLESTQSPPVCKCTKIYAQAYRYEISCRLVILRTVDSFRLVQISKRCFTFMERWLMTGNMEPRRFLSPSPNKQSLHEGPQLISQALHRM